MTSSLESSIRSPASLLLIYFSSYYNKHYVSSVFSPVALTQWLTDRCWKSQALMMLVATFGKIPRFLLFRRSRSVSSSSPVLGDATAPSRPSPVRCGKVSLGSYVIPCFCRSACVCLLSLCQISWRWAWFLQVEHIHFCSLGYTAFIQVQSRARALINASNSSHWAEHFLIYQHFQKADGAPHFS